MWIFLWMCRWYGVTGIKVQSKYTSTMWILISTEASATEKIPACVSCCEQWKSGKRKGHSCTVEINEYITDKKNHKYISNMLQTAHNVLYLLTCRPVWIHFFTVHRYRKLSREGFIIIKFPGKFSVSQEWYHFWTTLYCWSVNLILRNNKVPYKYFWPASKIQCKSGSNTLC